MHFEDEKDRKIEEWFSASDIDLKTAKVLHDNNLFANSLYHLQQSNEKLAKALLLSIGFLTLKRAPEDWRTKSVLGFLPKQPSSYRHRMLPSLLSDIEKSVPSIEEFLTLLEKSERLLENSGFTPRVAELHKTIRTSKKAVQKLKKKPPSLVQTTEQIEIEIKASQAILDEMEKNTIKVNQELEKLDYLEILRTATLWMRKSGVRVDTSQPEPDFDKIKEIVVRMLRLVVLAMLSTALASLLDPLEPITRYPDSQHPPFDQNNPFVKNFNGLCDVIRQCLQKGITTFTS